MWLTPPIMNSQMTRLALGVKCGLPSGGCHPAVAARAIPLLFSIAPSARPVKPMPKSARKPRRGKRVKIRVLHMATFHRMVTKSLWLSRT